MGATLKWSVHSDAMRAKTTREYFGPKAKVYDLTDTQSYWAFSDKLLWRLLDKHCLQAIAQAKPDFKFLDAGCGTARWSSRILEHYKQSTAQLVDITPEMLGVSQQKLKDMKLDNRASFSEMDLNKPNPDLLKLETYDLIISFHNVLSFLVNPLETIKNFNTALKPNGKLVLVVPNVYHAAYFSVLNHNLEELNRVQKNHAVKFHPSVPEMLLFTAESLKKNLSNAGWKDVQTMGFPVTVYPNMEEANVEGNSSQHKNLFTDKNFVAALEEIEWEFCQNQDAASRGNNLLIIAGK